MQTSMNDKTIIQKIIYDLFNGEFDNKYAIIKLNPQFPNITIGSDIDFFVYNAKNFIHELDKKLKNNIFIKVKIKKFNSIHHHYNIYEKTTRRLLIKLDLYSEIPNFQVVKVKNKLFLNLLSNPQKKTFKIQSKNINIFIPSLYFDLILRYIEYYEFFWTGYPKDIHLNFIKKAFLNDDKKLRNFLSYINYYTELPLDFHYKYSNLIQNYKKKLKLKYYIKKIIKKFLNLNI